MLRAWAENLPEGATEIVLDADEAHHLGRVRRAKVGETVAVLDGRGGVATGVWVGFRGSAGVVEVTSLTRTARTGAVVRLGVAPPKRGTWPTILEQAVEMGVAEVVPLFTERTDVRLEGPDRRARWVEKSHATLREAAKQSGNPWIPALAQPATWETWLATADPAGARLWACLEPGSEPLADAVARLGQPAAWAVAIGPEGDFSPAEHEAARTAGWTPISLGNTILRTETAVVAVSAFLRLAASRD